MLCVIDHPNPKNYLEWAPVAGWLGRSYNSIRFRYLNKCVGVGCLLVLWVSIYYFWALVGFYRILILSLSRIFSRKVDLFPKGDYLILHASSVTKKE